MKKVIFFTGNRAEYGLQIPIIKLIRKNKKFKYGLIVSGSHLDKNYGNTINEIKLDNFKIISKIKFNSEQNIKYTPLAMSKIIRSVTKVLSKQKPDIFIAYADRFETFAASIAASMMNICVAHIEAGDITNGGTHDDNIRHAISKLANIHFTSTHEAKNNIISMGEEKWRVHNVGFSGLDLIKQNKYGGKKYLKEKYNIDFDKQIIIFTYHPLTSNFKKNIKILKPCLDSLRILSKKFSIIITFPNNDLGSKEIVNFINLKLSKIKNFYIYKSLGRFDYHSFLSLCLKNSRSLISLGNSSSGIKETASFYCPTINIKPRQNGRIKGVNIIDVDPDKGQILKAIKFINNNDNFIKNLRKNKNIYGNGMASKKIVKVLEKLNIDQKLMIKKHF